MHGGGIIAFTAGIALVGARQPRSHGCPERGLRWVPWLQGDKTHRCCRKTGRDIHCRRGQSAGLLTRDGLETRPQSGGKICGDHLDDLKDETRGSVSEESSLVDEKVEVAVEEVKEMSVVGGEERRTFEEENPDLKALGTIAEKKTEIALEVRPGGARGGVMSYFPRSFCKFGNGCVDSLLVRGGGGWFRDDDLFDEFPEDFDYEGTESDAESASDGELSETESKTAEGEAEDVGNAEETYSDLAEPHTADVVPIQQKHNNKCGGVERSSNCPTASSHDVKLPGSLAGVVMSVICGVAGIKFWRRNHPVAQERELTTQQEKIRDLEEQLLILEKDRRRITSIAKEVKASKRAEERELKEYAKTLQVHLDQVLLEKRELEEGMLERIKAETAKVMKTTMQNEKEATELVQQLSSDLEVARDSLEQALQEKAGLDAMLRKEQARAVALEEELTKQRGETAEISIKLGEATSTASRAKAEAEEAFEQAERVRTAEAERIRKEMEMALAEEKEHLRRQMESRLASMREGLKQRLREVRAERAGKGAAEMGRRPRQGGEGTQGDD